VISKLFCYGYINDCYLVVLLKLLYIFIHPTQPLESKVNIDKETPAIAASKTI
jgi:hypothetical protein